MKSTETPAAKQARPKKRRAAGRTEPAPDPGKWLDLGLIGLFLALTFLLGSFPLKDTDFWWHLKAGDMIRQSGQVPTTDTLTFGASGHAWVDLHWLFQVLISLGYGRFGVVGLNVAKNLVTCAAVALLVTSGSRRWPTWATVLAWMPAILVLGGRMYIRPETLSLLYLAADLAIIARWRRHPWLAFALPVVQVLWVNSQGLFVFGPFLVGCGLIDAAASPGAFDRQSRRWWRIVLGASALTGAACLVNPYGLAGALYPLQLAGTMSDPIFKQSIAELEPILKLYEKIGLNSLPLDIHFVTLGLGLLSFVAPIGWEVAASALDRRRPARNETEPADARKPGPKGKDKGKKARQAGKPTGIDRDRPGLVFRVLLFATFSALSFAANRNSHQFAAVVGTITAWNFAEWAAKVRDRRRSRDVDREATVATSPARRSIVPRLATLGVVSSMIAFVGSGVFYDLCQEGRTVGLGEEPHWFPHEAATFAGQPGMPDRLVAYHNGHPSLFEYHWAPEKRAYTDARLEVMGPKLYNEYLTLRTRIAQDEPGWQGELDRMGDPSVMVDNIDMNNADITATLIGSRRYRCVYFDEVASVFVSDRRADIVDRFAVDFLGRHFRGDADRTPADPASLLAMTKAIRNVATQLRTRPSDDRPAMGLILLGLDHARRLREVEPNGLDGFKQAGLLEYLRQPLNASKPIPRYRLPFDPSIDLSLVRSSTELRRAIALDPKDGISIFYASLLDQSRGMDEALLPLHERFAALPARNLSQQAQKARSTEQAAMLRARLGPTPPTRWSNNSELEQLVDRLLGEGRARSAAEVIESATRAEARPWKWVDRLATLWLHLGEPERARRALVAATDAPPAPRSSRIGTTFLAEDRPDEARPRYLEAIRADPDFFDARYELATLELDGGHAAEAVEQARQAERTAPGDHARDAARDLIRLAEPYASARKPSAP